MAVASEKVAYPQPNTLNELQKSSPNKEHKKENKEHKAGTPFLTDRYQRRECGAASRPVFVRHMRPNRGAGAPTRKARRKRLSEKEGGGEIAPKSLRSGERHEQHATEGEGIATRRSAVNPARLSEAPRRFAVSFGQGLTAPLCVAS